MLCLPVLFSACATTRNGTGIDQSLQSATLREAYEARAEQLAGWSSWGFTARLSVDDGGEGGSGRLDWTSRPEQRALQFRGALGQGAWRLESNADGARLLLANGEQFSDRSVHELVRRETGWQVPVEALDYWVRGLPAPMAGDGRSDEAQLLENGSLSQLEQREWRITFDRYREVDGIPMPVRLEATNGVFRIKLAISRWWHAERGRENG